MLHLGTSLFLKVREVNKGSGGKWWYREGAVVFVTCKEKTGVEIKNQNVPLTYPLSNKLQNDLPGKEISHKGATNMSHTSSPNASPSPGKGWSRHWQRGGAGAGTPKLELLSQDRKGVGLTEARESEDPGSAGKKGGPDTWMAEEEGARAEMDIPASESPESGIRETRLSGNR